MENISILFTIIFVHFLAVISPGPDFVVAVRNSINYGRKIGIYTAVGFGLGIVLHLFYCYVGIAIIISQIPTLFSAIKIIGALYILYIAYQIFESRNTITVIDEKNNIELKKLTSVQALKNGFWTNAFNPKATLFFLGVFTTIIPVNINKNTLLVACVFMVLDTILWFSFVAYVFTQKKSLGIFQKYAVYINSILAILLTLLSLKILFL